MCEHELVQMCTWVNMQMKVTCHFQDLISFYNLVVSRGFQACHQYLMKAPLISDPYFRTEFINISIYIIYILSGLSLVGTHCELNSALVL